MINYLPRKEVFISKTGVILWLINPLFSLYYSLRHIRDPKVFPVLVLFSFFFGLTFVVPEDKEGAADSARYAAELRELHRQSLSLEQIADYLYNADSGKVDIYQPLMTWLVSYFTDNPQWLFAVFALVFGWFWFGNIQLVTAYLPHGRDVNLLLLLSLFALLNPIWEINGVRMWTAAQIFVYGLLLVFLSGEKKGYLYCLAALLVHFSFALPMAAMLAYRFLPKHTHWLFGIYVLSFFIRELNVEQIQAYFDKLPAFLQTRRSYVSDAYMEQFQEEMRGMGGEVSWHVLLAGSLQRYLFLFFSVLLYTGIRLRRNATDGQVSALFNAALFLSAFANVAANLPSGGRFLMVAQALILACLVIFYGRQGHRDFYCKGVLRLCALPMLFLLLFKLRTGFDFISITTVIGNPLIALLIADDIPLIDFVKSIF